MKTKLENNFEQIFDLPDSPPMVEEKRAVVVESNEHQDIDSDYKYARENLYNVIERGSDALNNLVDIAQASEHPRAYEVVGSLIKTLTDANKDLLEIQKKVKSLKEESKKGPDNVTNALFIGSTAELQKMINKD